MQPETEREWEMFRAGHQRAKDDMLKSIEKLAEARKEAPEQRHSRFVLAWLNPQELDEVKHFVASFYI